MGAEDAPDSWSPGTTDAELQLFIASFDHAIVYSEKRHEEVMFELVASEDPMWIEACMPLTCRTRWQHKLVTSAMLAAPVLEMVMFASPTLPLVHNKEVVATSDVTVEG
jgi:hypothetical protein